jgi:hypothetical protein
VALSDKPAKRDASGASPAFENKVGLSQKKLELLLELFQPLRDFGGDLHFPPITIDPTCTDFQPLQQCGADLHNRLLRYLVDDVDDEAALGELASRQDSAAVLGLKCAIERGFFSGHEKWGCFLETIEPIDPRFYLRLGKVFEAAARSLPPDRFFCQAAFDSALWLEILLQEATQFHAGAWSSEQRNTGISGPLIEAMLKADGRDIRHFITAPFTAPPRIAKTGSWWQIQMRDMVLRVADLGTTFALHRNLITPFLKEGPAESRLVAVENLSRAGAPATAFIMELVAAATGESKRVREAAEVLLATAHGEARPLLETVAREGSRNEREQAIRMLGNICCSEARPFLEELLGTENSGAVKEVIDVVLENLGRAQGSTCELQELPPHVSLPRDSVVTPPLRACLERLFNDYNEHAAKHNGLLANKSAKMYVYPTFQLESLGEKELKKTCQLLQNGGDVIGHFSKTLVHLKIHDPEPKGPLKAFLEHPDCRLIHVIRFLAMINELGRPEGGHQGMSWHAGFRVAAFRRAHEPKITLRHVAEAIRQVGLSDTILLNDVLAGYQRSFEWEPEAVWPFLNDNLARLERAFDAATGDWSVRWHQQRAFDGVLRVLPKFPQVPPALIGKLWDLAIGTSKAARIRAQKAVERLPDLFERLTKALASGAYQTRSVAAEWLGRLGDARAVAVLDAAARKEKHDAALDEILTALEKLGEPIEPYLDRKKLHADAEKGLKKGTRAALGWFPWAGLPKMHWSDTGKKIPTEVVTWLIVQNYKLKSAEAGPLLRRYCDLIMPTEREELARYILAAWLDQDLVRKHTDEQARTLAQQQAPQMWQMYQQALQWYQQQNQPPPAAFPQSLQQVQEQLYQGLCRECGSAIAEKGILAVAGACGSDSLVPPVQKYVKEWFGYRAAQCKALIAMLSAVDRPAAIQYLLSIANRFRTKGIREEAEKYVNILAERKGWSLDELADRTMPAAGFDDDGTLELNYGPRTFTARVNAALEAVLSDATGKVLKNLPDPRQDDDAELAKAAKATFSAAKKGLKKFAGMQSTRLYEAMCTQRTWPVADWRQFLMGHPLLRFLCQRLVWAVIDADEVKATFRPLDDGTLTDHADSEVALDDQATIRIAHGCQLSEAVAEGWKKHLADYEIAPLFPQFGRLAYTLAAEKRNETTIDDFQGHMVEAFKLRGLATKCGYTRGQAQDGGWFYDYAKTFPGLGLIAQLNFSGNGLPEENRQVALTTLSFQKSTPQEADNYMQSGSLPLGDIPSVLLTECYNDLAAIAKSGTGFDPGWEKKVH